MLLLATLFTAQAEVPEGWFLAGSKPANYEADVVDEAYSGRGSARYASLPGAKKGFGTMMQSISAEEFAGKRVRLAAMVKAEDVESWAGLWMRVDGPNGAVLAFDNMQDRPITGTSSWNRYEIVLDVGEDANDIAFGILIDRAGTVWLDDLEMEVVDDLTPLTGFENARASRPVNPSFERE